MISEVQLVPASTEQYRAVQSSTAPARSRGGCRLPVATYCNEEVLEGSSVECKQ
jgi:hypothetical protein